MEIIKIQILNPKAKRLLDDLADLKLIGIEKSKGKNEFIALLKKLRKLSPGKPDMEEITREVEIVRANRHAR